MTELISIFVNNILPVLIVAGVGYAAGKRLQVDPRSLGLLIFNVFSPMLVFYSLYDTHIAGDELGSLFALIALLQVSMAAISFAIMKLRGVDKIERASIMLSSFCLNAGNFGISVAAFAFGEDVLARAIVVYIGNTILNYTLGVFVASSGHQSPRQALLMVLRVPAFYGTIAALLLRGFNIELPLPVFRAVGVLKDAAIPAMLVLLGLQLSQSMQIHRWRLVSVGVVIKLLIAPVVAFTLASLVHLEGAAAVAFILQASMPTAVVILVMAKEYHLDETLTLNLIVATTLLSPFTLSVIILILRNTYLMPAPGGIIP